MSPKTNHPASMASKHQNGGGANTASSSQDLYNKTHEFVLSRIPDQSRQSRYIHNIMRSFVAQICLEIGWHSAHISALDVLADLTGRYLLQTAKQSKKYTEHYGRTRVNEDDIVLGFKDMNISVCELEEYIQNFDPVSITEEVPFFPMPRKTDLNFLRPGTAEYLSRPVHVHEYMPPMIFEESSESESEKETEKDESEAKQVELTSVQDQVPPNGIMLPLVLEEPSQVPEVASELVVMENNQPVVVCEEVEIKTENVENEDPAMSVMKEEEQAQLRNLNDIKNDLEDSSDDDIEPAASKAASIFATFKSTKKLESASENAALKRIRKMLEDQGHPAREVSSVIMTSSGFLSESREGRLPDSRPPMIQYDDSPVSSPPPERKKGAPTMKKILEGVKKLDKSESEGEPEETPGLFDVMDKIKTAPDARLDGHANVNSTENGVLADEVIRDIPRKKLSKQEKKLLQKHKKAIMKEKEKKLKLKSRDKLIKHAKSNLQAAAAKDLMEQSGSLNKSKLTIFKKPKLGKLDGSSSSSSSKKKKKDKKNKVRLKDMKLTMAPPTQLMHGNAQDIDEGMIAKQDLSLGTESIESDEDFAGGVEEQPVVPPMHIVAPFREDQQKPMILKKKIKKDLSTRPPPQIFDFHALPQQPSKKLLKAAKTGLGLGPGLHPSLAKAKLPKLHKRPLSFLGGEGDGDGLPIKKKRGRPKKVWGDAVGLPGATSSAGIPPGGPGSLHPSQLASIGKSLMIKEPALKIMKIRKEHMEVQDLAPGPPPNFITKPPAGSPNKAQGSSSISADLLKRLPAQPGLIPDKIAPVPPVRLPKELPSSISITPAALPSPQKEMGAGGSRGFPGTNLPPNVCSSVTITRIDMSHQQKLPSPYDDSITPGIGPPPGLEGPHKRSKQLAKGVPRPPPLQPQILAETESGITITPIMMGGASQKEHRYDEPLPPPPPLQARPQPKHSMLAKLDEELSSGSSVSTSVSFKEQRKKDKEKRKEQKKEKKKKAKDKSKDKSEKKKKKKDKSSSGGGDPSSLPVGVDSMDAQPTVPATVPKLTLKLSGHSNTPTPVDSPNPPQVFHDPVPPPPKKLTFKGLIEEAHKHVKQRPPAQEPLPYPEEEEVEVARFAPLVTRPQKPSRAAKANAAAGIAAVSIGATYSQQDIVQFPPVRDRDSMSGSNRRGRGRPPKGGLPIPEPPVKGLNQPSSSKPSKSSVTVLETETVGCIIDDEGNKIWICPACGRQDDGSPMIGCDKCDDWYHFPCVGITEEPSEEDQWYCNRCMRKQQKEAGSGKQKKRK